MRLIKEDENKVAVYYPRVVEDASTGEDIETYDRQDVVYYGQSKVDSERANIQAQIDFYADTNAVRDAVANLNTKKSDLDLIEDKLNE